MREGGNVGQACANVETRGTARQSYSKSENIGGDVVAVAIASISVGQPVFDT